MHQMPGVLVCITSATGRDFSEPKVLFAFFESYVNGYIILVIGHATHLSHLAKISEHLNLVYSVCRYILRG